MDLNARYSVLGTVRVLRGGTEVDPGPPKRMALLALLVLRAPGPLLLSEAVDVLWGEAPPASAVNVVHRHIGALRRTLEPELRSRTEATHLVRTADGYRLRGDSSTSDLPRFRDLRARAQRVLGGGSAAQAAQDFMAALRLWRGPVVATGTQVAQHPVFTSVGHEFVATVKEAADTVLSAAPALTDEALATLRRAVECHPFDEALHRRIIAALAATGRQAEALQQFEGIRRGLAEELGVDPGPELCAARQRLLRHRDSGETCRTARRPTAAGGPSRLPADCASFAGCRKVLSRCLELLPPERGTPSHTTTAVICGMAGVGKTTPAVHWGHRASERFPDGRIHVDLRGHHPSLPPLEPAGASAERAAREELVELCGGLPLALAVAGARALARPRLALSTITAALRDPAERLDMLSGSDARTDTRSVFHRSYDLLDGRAARLFRLLGLHPSREITLPAGTDLCRTRQDVAELMDHHLLVEPIAGRYACHGLLHAFAAELCLLSDPPSARSEALARIVERYLYSTEAASALLTPGHDPLVPPPRRPGIIPQRFAGHTDAAEWIAAERYVLPDLARSLGHGPGSERYRRLLASAVERCVVLRR
ncbi:BTAD domain-containing putative transcriptional regulator [Streptomyces sp. TLI_105]|uniref:BTAD domain-containing putative transcriptional regulator n=1 Tax=Streptomyces sp. TLI_105 TaxID=1881019 RepID=UPI0008968B84|nr:BTAD domain-containing putative transcriptional regulator [Streptomyces sp. TLI_105]SEE58972.1 DNA-binding transcriptional activator of the SARP family [Streptomyces sp. TLI_105]